MDPTYSGAYGRLKVSRLDFVSGSFVDQLEQKDSDEFVKMLGTTSYRKELDALSGLYSMPDVVEVVINAHMMSMIKNATFALPPLARNFVAAYVSKWDIDNIKTILSSKVLGYSVENTETFITVQRGTPVGLFGGGISREDYVKLIEQKDIEGVCNALTKFGYGTMLLRYIDDAKKTNDISPMILALDTYYYSHLLESFRFYNGNEGPVMQYIRGLIDIKNVMTVMKCIDLGNKNPKDYLIKGGTIPENKLIEMASKSMDAIKGDMPFKIDEAFERYRKDEFMAYLESALKKELYKKYLRAFDSIPLSLETIIAFVLRSELERDELRAIWLGKYYKISKERTESMRVLKYVIS
jgi:V/A-type H+/Na+-transporting ATPase subunit C